MNQGEELKVRKFFDRHVHFRDGMITDHLTSCTRKQCWGAIVMPNLDPPITTSNQADRYKKSIYVPKGISFTPHMTCYLTDNTNPDDLEDGFGRGSLIGAKLYPKGTTTNSENGVTDIKNIYSVLEKMQEIDMPLLVHGEVSDMDIDFFDREAVFISRVLISIVDNFPNLKIVMEHVSTKEAVEFVEDGNNKNVWATVTAHHLTANRNIIFQNGIDSSYFCYPILKSEKHRRALVRAVTSGKRKDRFGAGTDSAPHVNRKKLIFGGAGGIFILTASELYVSIFEKADALDYLDDFLSVNLLEEVYGITPEKHWIVLKKEEWEIPESYTYYKIRPFMAGETLQWRIKSQTGR